MKVAASSICWMRDNLETAIKKARAAGFTAFEPLTFPSEIWDLHGDLRKIDLKAFRRLFTDNGMTIAALHLGAIMTPTEERRRVLTDYCKRAIEVAQEVGAGIIVEGGPDRGVQPMRPFLKSLEELTPLLNDTGVKIALENHYGNWIQFIQDYEFIFDYIDHPNLGITLDTGHFTSAGVDSEEVARRFTSKIFHVHVKDHRGQQSVALGSGETNNFGMARVLKAAGYAGYLSQELELHDAARADAEAANGIAYMRALASV